MLRVLDDNLLRRIHHAEHEGMYLHELAKMYHVNPSRLKTSLADWRVRYGKQAAVTTFMLEKAARKAAPCTFKKWGKDREWLFPR